MPARFYEQDIKARLKDKRKLSAFLDELVKTNREEVKKVQLTYIFCSDEHLLGINREFLNHDTYTDIITFDLSDSEKELVGEIYVSVDRVAENAEKFKISYNQELHRVIFHGALHLSGFKDKSAKDKAEMRKQEENCLRNYGL
jgi:probable rRNA maturation factor